MKFNLRTLSEPLQEVAKTELNEDPSQIQTNLELLRNWLKQQEHLKYNNDDQFLLNFLRSTKFSLQRTKDKLDSFYSFRTFAPDLSRDLDPMLPLMQSHLKLTSAVPLATPKDNPASPRIILIRFSDYDPDKLRLTDMLKGDIMLVNVLSNIDDNFIVSGAIPVWDLSTIKLKTTLQATPIFLKKLVFCFEKAFPTRLRGLYIMNAPKFMEQVLGLFKGFLSKKLAKRLHVYSTENYEDIFKELPRSIFPKDYGGDAGSYDDLRAEWKKTIESQRDFLLAENNYCSDESKRPEKNSNFGDIFGVEGSFRSLQID